MKTFLLVVGIAIASYGITFAVFWVLNPPINGTGARHRDWWRNRPTKKDPARWERYKASRKAPNA